MKDIKLKARWTKIAVEEVSQPIVYLEPVVYKKDATLKLETPEPFYVNREAVFGLTVVAIGTSLPELAVSVIAALEGAGDMSVGNVVGSNIFNISVVLGATCLLFPIAIQKEVLSFELPVVLFISVLLLILGLAFQEVSLIAGIIFLVMLVGYVFFLIYRSKKQKENIEEEVEEESEEPVSPFKSITKFPSLLLILSFKVLKSLILIL